VVEVYEQFAKIVDEVRAGGGPVLVEMKTYRLAGHYYGDNENYRTREEVEQWRQKCPIIRLGKLLKEEYGCTEEELDAIVKEERAAVLAASEEAKGDPEPSPADLTEDLYEHTYREIAWKTFQKQ